jgi:Uma2 family endonuclease
MEALKYEYIPNYTYEEYQHWEGEWELIDGIAYAMAPAPVKKHQKLVGYIFSEIISQLNACTSCEVLIDSDWKLNSHTVFRPDVSVVCNDSNENYISKTPEVIFEVISPSTASKDEGLKYTIYAKEGVKYYVLIYPHELIAKVYKNKNFHFEKVGEFDTDTIKFTNLKCPFSFHFHSIFNRFRQY